MMQERSSGGAEHSCRGDDANTWWVTDFYVLILYRRVKLFTLSMDDCGSQLEQDDVATFDTIDRRSLLSLCYR